MRFLWRGALLPLLRRPPGEIERLAARFRIRTPEGRELVAGVGSAFTGGFNSMLGRRALEDVRAEGMRVASHYRPFFFEGAAMGYLPRRLLRSGPSRARAERDLLGMNSDFRYLYYVGLGFWFAMRSRRPSSLAALRPHLDPIYYPLCYDGFGFKVAFYEALSGREVRQRLDECPEAESGSLWQGFGRGLYFVWLDDPAGFESFRAGMPEARRLDLEFGRSLALGFTRVDRPSLLLEHVASAPDEEERSARLGGVTWALTARRMNDVEYFDRCVAKAPPGGASLLATLPALCEEALRASRSYLEWQSRTREAAVRVWREAGAILPAGS